MKDLLYYDLLYPNILVGTGKADHSLTSFDLSSTSVSKYLLISQICSTIMTTTRDSQFPCWIFNMFLLFFINENAKEEKGSQELAAG